MLSTLMVSAHDIEVKNAQGVTIYYNYINEGTELAVTFCGDTYDSYGREYTEIVVIPEEVTFMNRTRKVTSIGENAFRDCFTLYYVTIPNSVTSIGKDAFSGCTGLKKVIVQDIAAWCGISFGSENANPLYYAHHLYSDENAEITNLVIPNSVTSIGDWAFSRCSGLTSVTIPNSVTSIGDYTFYVCSGLTSVTIGNSVTSIGNGAFAGCSGLTSITIPNSVTSIEYGAFSGCSGLTSVTIPNSVTSIGNYAFSSCSGLTSVTIPNSVTSIGSGAFYNCKNLTSVTIPNSVTSIGSEAFYKCTGLTSVTIGSGVTSIGSSAFDGVDIPTVVSLIENPFAITGKTSNSRTFTQNTFMNATLYVPKGTKEKYKSTTGWKDFVFIEEGAGGGDTPETQKCATPTITYENGKLRFSCETEGVEFVYNITPPSAKAGSGTNISMPTTYKVTVYAKKDGFENSDVATKEIDLGTSGIRGDLNGDGLVNMPDAMFIVNKILNGKFPDEEDNGSKPGVRFGFYETIPGYSVKIDKVNMDGVSPYVMGSNAVGTILSRTSSQPTWDKANGSYSFVDFANSNDMFVRIDYTLTADDGSGEIIVVKDAVATIPTQYIQWKSDYKYTYIIKIYDNTNTFNWGETPVSEIYPATFDAIVIEDDNGQSTVTNITTR